ncbi:bifunctional diguanylate cyclase/phosphodiesterase [Marinomonas pollencensis]|uniref:Diguanylate cyclase (GGDEF)-like protein n=1 Tax=Marinomonas pollencensis TaxID=491954 RepID=A0A3E0DLP5_9GAMM|nr:EAL domain-containing protein [Marinomonas pollencensis]REG83760.1 diguanylate cyclase (GGDEF)-like protein [Marinomonas pollencensis]
MFNTLKGRLYFLSILIVMPFYFFTYLSFDYSRDIIEEEFLVTAEIVSNQVAENQEELVSSTRRFLVALASLPQVRQPNSEHCRRFVSDLTLLFERYINIGIPNDEGILTCNGTALTSPLDVYDRQYIQQAMNQDRFTSSGVQIDRAVGRPTINFAYPIHLETNNKYSLGVAVAVITLDWWNLLLSNSQLPEKSVAYVLDSTGKVVASYPNDLVFEPPQTFNTIVEGNDDIYRVFVRNSVFNEDGQVLLTFLTGVSVDKPISMVKERYTVIVASFTLMVIVMLVLLRVFFMNTISKPLNRLGELAMRLGRNEKVYTALPIGVKEMDDLQNSFLDMAKHKVQAEELIVQQAQTDSLTALSNRDALNFNLAKILCENQDNRQVGVILLDLDNFKEVNDTRGHETGDVVLKMIASRLIRCAPSAKLISRIGGDEFILLLDNIDEEEIVALSEQIRLLIKEPFNVSHFEIVVTASIGIALFPDDGTNAKELMVAVDQAMYFAKQSGRDATRRFSWELKEALTSKIELIQDLRHAILNQEFHLLYQPIVNKYGKVTKFEALIRWVHPEKGLIPPDRFIQFAEESGQIVEIGHWVIQEAKRALASIREVHGDQVQISVNVSPIQLSKQQGEDGRLLAELLLHNTSSRKIQQHNGLIVEITEHLLMNSDESTRKALLAFREEGIQVALDDFGTGYSSLAYIMNYDIDYLKIDREFVQKLGAETTSETLCEAIISMAHALGVLVVAEGVETQEQADLLLGYGCDYLQGYYFSKPIPLQKVLSYQQGKVLLS